jgi:polysaccharide export outer membrane protein
MVDQRSADRYRSDPPNDSDSPRSNLALSRATLRKERTACCWVTLDTFPPGQSQELSIFPYALRLGFGGLGTPPSGKAKLRQWRLDVAASYALSHLCRTTGRRVVGKPSINQLARKLPEAATEANPISLNLHLVLMSNLLSNYASAIVLLFSLLAPAVSIMSAETEGEGGAKSLVQFLQDGKRNGLTDANLKQSAIKAGWESHTIDMALSIADSGMGVAVTVGNALPGGYRIGAGDILQIVVWKELDASVPETVVRADGKISVPLVKEVEIAGLTPTEAEQMLTQKFAQFIHDADVTVVPKQINSKKAYLVGAIRREGPVPIRSAMTVLQAILEAGGLTEYAKPKKIYVLRKQNGKEVRLPFDYSAVIKGEQQQQNVLVQPDDAIVVPH